MKIEDIPGWNNMTMEFVDDVDVCASVYGGEHELCPQLIVMQGHARRVLCDCWCHKKAEVV